METSAHELATSFVCSGLSATCIPVFNDDNERDVATVALEPTDIALLALTHESVEVRINALIAVAYRAHELLPSEGLRFAGAA
jgi:hypothetical protein